jgi:LysR family transcriptional regulator, glycine cleavage system transcriptional activator
VMTEDWSGIACEFLMPDILVPVCSPALLSNSPPLREPSDLLRHQLLHTATRPHAWPDWLRAVSVDIPISENPSYGHFFMTLQAAAQGKGVACVPRILIADDLASGRLVAPLPQQVPSAGAYHLLYRKHEEDSRKVSVFREWLKSEADPYKS